MSLALNNAVAGHLATSDFYHLSKADSAGGRQIRKPLILGSV